MGRRLKIVLASIVLAFSIAIMGFGVYAANSHTLNIENYISFDIGENISFSIKGERSSPTGSLNARTKTVDSYYNQTFLSDGQPFEVGMADSDGKLSGWNISSPVVKLYAGESMSWTFTIINKSENPFYVNIIDSINPWGENASFIAQDNVLVPANQTPVAYTITFQVVDAPSFEANRDTETLSFNLKLDKNRAEKPATLDKLSFNLVEDDTNGDYYSVSAREVGLDGDIVIPNTYKPTGTSTYSMSRLSSEALPVKTIASGGFRDCTNITSIDFSNCTNLTTIESGAFSNCSGLMEVDLSNCENLTTIESGAFSNCANLITLNLSNLKNLNAIEYYAFYGCNKLIRIQYDTNAPAFSYGADIYSFGLEYYNENLEIIDQNASFNGSIVTSGDYNYLILNDTKYLLGFSTKGLFNTKVKNIALDTNAIHAAAFSYNEKLLEVDLSNHPNLEFIGKGAFEVCVNLATVNLSNCPNLERLNDNSFGNCYEMTSINLSNCSNLDVIGESCFVYCSKLQNINFESCTKLSTIFQYAFSNCESLTYISLSPCTSLNLIGNGVFQNCYNLYEVDFSGCSKLSVISNSTFYYCYRLVHIRYNKNAKFFYKTVHYYDFGLENENPDMEIIDETGSFVNEVVVDGDYAYYIVGNKKYLLGFSLQGANNKEVVVASDVTDIYHHAFENTKITSIDVSNCISLNSIGDYAFFLCYEVQSIDLSKFPNIILGQYAIKFNPYN